MKPSILVVDDEPAIREGLVEILEAKNYEVRTASDGQEALDLLERHHTDVVLTDIRMPRLDGMELLKSIKSKSEDITVILLTGHATFSLAVEAVKAGAYDFLTKPFDVDHVRLTVARALEHRKLLDKNARLERRVETLQGDALQNKGAIIGESPDFKDVLTIVDRAAPTPSTVLIMGETGTGKEIIARAVHDRSERRERPFLSINCGALNETLLESELFGHAKGAFTGADRARPGLFEAADGGTFFLDEIGNVSSSMQAKLLRVLQEGEVMRVGERAPRKVDVRIVAATNADLKAEVEGGDFREDLYYRLNVVRIELPPLRDRVEDIALLANAFREKMNAKLNRQASAFSPDALSALKAYRWPGNVRELENAIERAMIMALGEVISSDDLPSEVRGSPTASLGDGDDDSSVPEGELTLAELEKRHILRVLQQNDGHQGRASMALGINRRTLYRKLQEYGWDPKNPG